MRRQTRRSPSDRQRRLMDHFSDLAHKADRLRARRDRVQADLDACEHEIEKTCIAFLNARP
jgi:hypothetical protein